MSYTATLLIGLALLVFVLFRFCSSFVVQQNFTFRLNQNKKPNGLFNLPLVGYLPFISKMPHQKFYTLSQKYGSIFQIKLGNIDTIVLNDFYSISQAFKKEEFLGRPTDISFNVLIDLEGLGTLSGQQWREQKRFTMQQLRNLGFGKQSMEQYIKENILRLMEKIDGNLVQAISVRQLFSLDNFSMPNLLFGNVHGKDDQSFLDLQDLITDAIQSLGQVSVLTFFPTVAKLLARSKLFPFINKLKANFSVVNSYIKNEIKKHESTLTNGSPRDYIDSFLMELNKHETDKETTFTKQMLAGNVQGFLAAGIETVRSSLEWSLLTLAFFQDVQDKMYNELHRACGNQTPCWSHRASLIYTQAVICEIQRWKTISPLNLMRMTTENTRLSNFAIAKHVYVIANLWAVHFDARYWKEPHKFDPNRFIGIDGQLLKHKRFIPFSIGKRSCPGETLAQMEMFMILTSLVQKYRILPTEDFSFEETLGLTLQPKRCVRLKFEKRDDHSAESITA